MQSIEVFIYYVQIYKWLIEKLCPGTVPIGEKKQQTLVKLLHLRSSLILIACNVLSPSSQTEQELCGRSKVACVYAQHMCWVVEIMWFVGSPGFRVDLPTF